MFDANRSYRKETSLQPARSPALLRAVYAMESYFDLFLAFIEERKCISIRYGHDFAKRVERMTNLGEIPGLTIDMNSYLEIP
jgi:hypothetical protein